MNLAKQAYGFHDQNFFVLKLLSLHHSRSTFLGNGARSVSFAGKKRKADRKMDLQTVGRGRISRKRPALVVGKKPNGKCRLSARGNDEPNQNIL
jgi:hypothetical protein